MVNQTSNKQFETVWYKVSTTAIGFGAEFKGDSLIIPTTAIVSCV